MIDTPANRALVNRGIAEAMGYQHTRIPRESEDCQPGAIYATRGSAISTMAGWERLDYTRDLNACYDVCEERGWLIETLPVAPFIVDVTIWRLYKSGGWGRILSRSVSGRHTDLRWLVALAVWEAVKATRTCGAPDCDDTAHPCG